MGLKHLATRPKKQQLIDDRRQAIARENKKLMENMAKILSESRINTKPNPASSKLRSINESQRKSQVERLNFENRLLFNRFVNIYLMCNSIYFYFNFVMTHRLQAITPMLKRDDLQKDYDKHKSFHSKRKKFVPFGVGPSSSSVITKSDKAPSYDGIQHEEDDNNNDINDPESESFLSQYRSMNSINMSGNYSQSHYGDNPMSPTNSDIPQSISEFRRQVISKKKLQNNMNNSSSTINMSQHASKKSNNSFSSSNYVQNNNESKTKFMLTHDPKND